MTPPNVTTLKLGWSIWGFQGNFIGRENIISAVVHLDEGNPHLHLLHVPVTEEGRLPASKIYTRESLRKLQDDPPQYQST